jgi:thiol:disulfide interchange protein
VQAAAFATAVGTAAFMVLGPVESLIEWERPFSRARLAELRQAGNTVMVDFSADWCPTCKFNLATAIETRRVKKLVEKNRVVPLLADWTDGSPEIKQMLESLESRSIPVLAIFPGSEPGQPLPEPIVLRDLLTESQVLEALEQAGPSCCPPPEIRAASTVPAAVPTTVGR